MNAENSVIIATKDLKNDIKIFIYYLQLIIIIYFLFQTFQYMVCTIRL